MSGHNPDMTWKDIPWAHADREIPIGVGVQAVVPEIGPNGEKTGKFETLDHETYVRIMGDRAYIQSMTSGDPDEILDRLRHQGPETEKPPMDGVYLKPPVVEKVKK